MSRPAVGTRLGRGMVVCATVLVALVLAPSSGAYIYWVGGSGAIGRANLDGTAINPAFITGLHNPGGVAVNAGHIYWTAHDLGRIGTGAIGRANLDGTEISALALAGTYPNDVAVNGENVYWTDSADYSVGRASLLFPSGASLIGGAFGSAVAADEQHVYWAYGGEIARANPDGTQIESFIMGLNDVRALAVDARHIYWADSGDNKIGRADLDGSHVIRNFINGVVGVSGVAVDGQHVYWTTTGGASIGRASLDGTGVQNSFIPGLAGVGMIAVDSFPHPTATGVQCAPSPLPLGQVLTCTATVTDPASSAPQGSVRFTATQQGAFAPSATCALVPADAVASACAVTFRPFGPGRVTITGAYLGTY